MNRKIMMIIYIVIIFQNIFAEGKNRDYIDITDIESNINNLRTEVIRSNNYVPNKIDYKGINVKEFSSEWISLYVFENETLYKNDLDKLNDVNSYGTDLTLCIQKDEFIIINGLYKKNDNSTGAFIAKINSKNNSIMEILEINENRDKPIYFKDDGNRFFIVKRLYSSNFIYAFYENITELHREIYD